MLTRLGTFIAVSIATLGWTMPAQATSHHPGPITVSSNPDGAVGITIVVPGHGPHRQGSGATPVGVKDPTVPPVFCPWVQVHSFQGSPLPAMVNGKRGTWWDEYCNGNGLGFAGAPTFVPRGNKPGRVLTVSPAVLALRAESELQIPQPSATRNPTRRALVNLAEWFWVKPSQWHSLTRTAAAGAEWATVTARPVSTSWRPGDGSAAVVCSGSGTPYDPSVQASAQSTNCSHTYTRSSAGQPQTGSSPNDRYFTVTVTATWRVTWVGAGGTSGTLQPITRTATFPLAVAQRETVVTGGSG